MRLKISKPYASNKHRLTVQCLLLTLLFCFGTNTFAQSHLNSETLVANDPSVKIGKLKNGLTYYIKKNATPKNKVELRLVVKAGSVDEDDDQQGIAHFVEHMAFNGTKNFKGNTLIDALRSIGVEFGADLNANTAFDRTTYLLPIPTEKKSNIELGFKILEDWAHGIVMDDAEIEKERNVILEETRQRKGVGQRFLNQVLPSLLNNSKYAKRQPIGKEETIKNAPHEVLRRFYNDWYRPNLMAVIVVGDIAPKEAEKLITQHFAHLENPVNERTKITEEILPYAENNALVFTDTEQSQNEFWIAFSPDKYSIFRKIRDYRETFIESLYEAMLGKRLTELTQQASPPFLSASFKDMETIGSHSFMSFQMVLGKGGREKAIQAIMQEVSRAREFGFLEQELALAKKRKIASLSNQVNEENKNASVNFINEYVDHFLYQSNILSAIQYRRYWEFHEPNILVEDINAFAKKAYKDDAHKLAIYIGSNQAGENNPSTTELLNEIAEAQKMKVEPREEKKVARVLMRNKPQPGKILSELSNRKLGTVEMRLSNGIKVILKKTDFKNDEILFSCEKFGGTSVFENKDYLSAKYSDHFIFAMGLAQFTPIQIGDILSGKTISVNRSIGTYSESISGNSSLHDMETLFQMLYLRITSPRKDPVLFDTNLTSFQEAVRKGVMSPEAILSEEFSATLFNNHPRAGRQPTVDELQQLNIDRTLAIYKERQQNFNGASFVFVGNFDMAKIRPLIAQYLAAIPNTGEATSYRDIHLDTVKGVVKKEVFAGIENKAAVLITFAGEANYSREERTHFYALLEILRLKMNAVLREKLGLVYTASVDGDLVRAPNGRYYITFYVPCSPENTDQLIAALFTEIEKLKTDTTQASEIGNVKKNWLISNRKEMRENAHWLSELADAALFGTDQAQILLAQKRINALNAEQIQLAAKRYLNTGNYVQMLLKPEVLKTQPVTPK
jgi:zinc protease